VEGVMKNFLYLWAISLPVVLILDLIWFSLTVEKFYKPYLGHIISDNFNYLAAATFYIIYSFGVSYLIVLPAVEAHYTVFKVLCNGFILGFIAYGAYDLTNQATIKDWPVIVTVVDMLWGATVTSLVSIITYKTFTYL
jgi:uncharacterized membrane protein